MTEGARIAREELNRRARERGEVPPYPQEAPSYTQQDADELAARRTQDVRLAGKYHGWKPLVVWYSAWAVLLVIGAFSLLGSGQVGPGLLGLAIAGLAVWYAYYLFHGGRHRVWFFIW